MLIDSLLVSHGLKPQQINYTTVPFPGVVAALTAKHSPLAAAFAPEPFVSGGEAAGLQELADLDQGSSQNFPVRGYAVTAAWAKKYLAIPAEPAAFISLPAFPLGVDATRLQRVVSAMTRFNLLPKNKFEITSMIDG